MSLQASPLAVEEGSGGLVVGLRHGVVDLGPGVGLRRAARPALPGGERRLHAQLAQVLRQGRLAGRAEGFDRLPVGLQDRHVDAVQRRAAHEAQDAQRPPSPERPSAAGKTC